ncbi:unnamed protein product, partial [Didymodactylos carnosus]
VTNMNPLISKTPATTKQWTQLNITLGQASYAQERIWLDEQLRLSITEEDKGLHSYNSLLVYKITSGSVSIPCLRKAIKCVINKHQIFRTSLNYDTTQYCLKQSINPSQDDSWSYQFTRSHLDDNEKIDELVFNEETSNKYFNLDQGRLFRCHLIKQTETVNNNDILNENDLVLLSFHHSAIDEHSRYLFLRDLKLAYTSGQLNIDDNELQYIDYSQHERQMDMTELKEFWKKMLTDFPFEHHLKLPYDHYLTKIGSGSSFPFQVDKSMIRQIFRYKQKRNVTMFRLFLSCYYVFLFKLINETDLCVNGLTPNRYRSELGNIIGPFENMLPYRFQLNPHQSFNEVVKQVEQLCQDIKENDRLPFQDIIALYRSAAVRSSSSSSSASMKLPFMQTLLRVDIEDDVWHLDDEKNTVLNKLSPPTEGTYIRTTNITPIDLTLKVKYNLNNKTLGFSFEYADNLFEDKTIELLSKRFQQLLKHLFDVSSTFDLDEQPVYELSIILSDEQRLIEK